MVALKMANPNELSSLEIKLLHALKDGPIGITQICKKLQVVREHAEKLTKILVIKRFITKQSNSQYRNLIKAAEIPELIKPAEMPAEPAAEPIPEPLPAPMAEFKPEPAASCTYPICSCEKDQCEEDPPVDTNAKAAKKPLSQRVDELTAMLREEVNHAAAFSADLEQTAKMFGCKVIELQSRNPLATVPFDKTHFLRNKPLLSQAQIEKINQVFDGVNKAALKIGDAVSPVTDYFSSIDSLAIKNAMERRQNSPLSDDLKQELYLITEKLSQPKAQNIQFADLDKKLNFISYLRLLLEKMPHTSTLLDEICADYMELKRQQETA